MTRGNHLWNIWLSLNKCGRFWRGLQLSICSDAGMALYASSSQFLSDNLDLLTQDALWAKVNVFQWVDFFFSFKVLFFVICSGKLEGFFFFCIELFAFCFAGMHCMINCHPNFAKLVRKQACLGEKRGRRKEMQTVSLCHNWISDGCRNSGCMCWLLSLIAKRKRRKRNGENKPDIAIEVDLPQREKKTKINLPFIYLKLMVVQKRQKCNVWGYAQRNLIFIIMNSCLSRFPLLC